MMRHATIGMGLVGLGLVAGGCAAPESTTMSDPYDLGVALTVISTPDRSERSNPNEFSLGAGDTLGQALFTNYVAIVKGGNPDWHYASGEARTE